MGKGFILWRGFANGEDRAAGDPREAGIRGRSPRRRLRRRACGAYRHPLPMAAERSGEAYGEPDNKQNFPRRYSRQG